MLGNTHIIIAKSGITRFQYQVTTQSSPPFNLQLSHAFCHRINFIRSSDTSGLREMNGGWIPAEVRRRFGSFRVQRIADYMRCHCREEEAFSDAPVPEKLLSRPGSLNLFGHSRREIGVKDAFSQRSHIFQTFPLGQTCRSPIDGEHIPSSMHREVRRRIHVNFFPNFSGHAPIFFYHLSCSLRLDETVSFFLTALLIAFKSCWFTLPNNR